MEVLEKLFRKKRKFVIGLMSGTSADGVDAVLLSVTGSGIDTQYRQLAFATYPYPKNFKRLLLKNSDAKTARLDDIVRLNFLVAKFFAQSARSIARRAGKRLTEIDLIGSHGQTIHHLPIYKEMFGKRVRGTLQIGHPSAIAKMTGIVTVGDFRIGDIAVGGTGAPLVPYFDYLMFRLQKHNRALLNIGGISNITLLPANCSLQDVLAFDTGPGNIVIDGLMMKLYGRPFDKNGDIASKGSILPTLLHWMAKHRYLQTKPPKSTGREVFGEVFINELLHRGRGEKRENLIATATEFTPLCVYLNYIRFIRKKLKIDEFLVSGGGVHNTFLMNSLQRYFTEIKIKTTDQLGVHADAKEAICFAILANETIAGNPANIPGATGASRSTVLGSICLP
ncbi:MAG TPA: anhydro-N-acetylmuramic acid kinase [Bacteroidota bacterium]|nr:anhydro-N-acetylmuramic acid kinase [Bacteroidota bacterium]